MKLLVLYRPNSEHARVVEEYVNDFQRRESRYPIDLVSLDTRDGSDKAGLYGVVQYPAMLVTRDDGEMVKFWEGQQFPLMNELASYLNG